MRSPLVMGGVVSILFATSVCCAETLPYTAYIQSEYADVRSGPGWEYYTTDRLVWGTKVEVHRYDPGPWCAIRPPQGSFSWIEKDKLKLTDERGIAEVIVEGAESYVGTRFGDEHHVNHVRLWAGELVEILGTKRLIGSPDASGRTWHKVAPPAGEFRWIDEKHLVRVPPDDRAENLSSVLAQRKNHSHTTEEGELAKSVISADANEPRLDLGEPSATISRLSHETEARDVSENSSRPVPADFVPRKPDSPSRDRPSRQGTSWHETGRSPHGDDGGWWTNGSNKTLSEDELAQINVQLSLTVSRDPAEWKTHDLRDLRSRVEAVIDSSRDATHRDRAREMLGKIVQFEDIKRRHDRIEFSSDGLSDPLDYLSARSERSQFGPLPPIGSGVSPGDRKAVNGTLYDGTGWLMPVITRRRGVPRYALTDKNGHILQFVTPAPGVNLRRFERQELGIIGRRGYVPQFRRPHLTAERVVVLNRHRR